MELSKKNYEIILNELKNVDEMCEEAKMLEDKLYFYSASFGIINRIMNLECEPILVFMHEVLQANHRAITSRHANPKRPGVVSDLLPNELIDLMFIYYKELIHEFENQDEEAIHKVLQKISNLTYATSGNGYFLYVKGLLKI